MRCDEVFEILTRGPFPSGDADKLAEERSVERHLATCSACRELAEALRPATDALDEARGASDELPGYRGVLPGTGEPLLARVIDDLWNRDEARPEAEPRRTSPAPGPATAAGTSTSWAVAALAALAVVAAGMVVLQGGAFGEGWASRSNADEIFSTPSTLVAAPPTADARLLSLLRLPPACGLAFDARGIVDRLASNCCTECHHAPPHATVHISPAALSLVRNACRACHE